MYPTYPSYKAQALAPDPPKNDVQWCGAVTIVWAWLWRIANKPK